MGRLKRSFQDGDYVLSWFGKSEGEGRKAYRRYVEEGISQGRQPELVGGGLVRSFGGWSAVLSMKRVGQEALTDQRILGRDDFVGKVLGESDSQKQFLHFVETKREMGKFIQRICREEGVNLKEMQMGSRRGRIPHVRAVTAFAFAEKHGMPLAVVARQLGVSTSAISKILRRGRKERCK